jgi:hypothetical protein
MIYQQEFDKQRRAIVAHCKLRPGLNLNSIATILGWDKGSTRAIGICNRLQEAGVIRVEEPNKLFPYPRVFFVADVASVSPPPDVEQYVVVAPESGDRPNPPNGVPALKRKAKTSALNCAKRDAKVAQKRQQLESALNELIATGQPFNLIMLQKKAGLKEQIIYGRHYVDIKERANRAIAAVGRHDRRREVQTASDRIIAVLSRLEQSGEFFSLASLSREAIVSQSCFYQPHYSDLRFRALQLIAQRPKEESKEALLTRIADLEQRNKELRQQISAQIQSTPNSSQTHPKLTQNPCKK